MCGIAGYWGLRPPSDDTVDRTLDLMKRRGPDHIDSDRVSGEVAGAVGGCGGDLQRPWARGRRGCGRRELILCSALFDFQGVLFGRRRRGVRRRVSAAAAPGERSGRRDPLITISRFRISKAAFILAA